MLETSKKTGILLVQLGTPDDASVPAVRRYLREFLSDARVVDTNRILWFIILNFFILPVRAKKSAALYQRFFGNHGPTLRTYCESLTKKLQRLSDQKQNHLSVRYGMRYGNLHIRQALRQLTTEDHCERIFVVPLFPQYCNATTGSVEAFIENEAKKLKQKPEIKFIQPYYNHVKYIESLYESIQNDLNQRDTKPDTLLLSYHGIPKRYVENGDPYHKMCLATTEALLAKIDFPKEKICHTYQSRFGKEEWLSPYTDDTLEELAQQGKQDVMVACPAFTMDCLETLDEICIESTHKFKAKGGKNLTLIPCLNDNDTWSQNLLEIIETEMATRFKN